MSYPIYQSKISAIGALAQEALADDFMITFCDGAPAELAEYCFTHQLGELKQALTPGQLIQFGRQKYKITAVGEVANQNLRELGHITIRFDGQPHAELPGAVHVEGETPNHIQVGDEFIISIA